MSDRKGRGLALALMLGVAGVGYAIAQSPPAPQQQQLQPGTYTGPKHISDELMVKNGAELTRLAADPKWERKVTIPEDWNYSLAPGVTTKHVSFYVDGGTRLQARIFYPKDFDPKAKYPAVAGGHGINAIAIGIEKFPARFAERGFVAMAIDYQSYGFSDSGADELMLLEPDTSTDASPVTVKRMLFKLKRTNLNNVEEIKAFRAAISYLQGEPGVDPDRIGTWATSNGGSVEGALVGIDGRTKATVIQVSGVVPGPMRALDIPNQFLADAIKRVNTGQGEEVRAGFSFQTNVDGFYRVRNRDANGGPTLDRVRPTTAVLFMPAEKDELTNGNSGALAGSAYLTKQGVPSQVITFPGLSHFQPYSGLGFEVGSTLAADWFVKYLGGKK